MLKMKWRSVVTFAGLLALAVLGWSAYRLATGGEALEGIPQQYGRPLDSTEGRIAFVAQDRQGTDNLYVANIDGTGLTQVTNQTRRTSTWLGKVAWSPDGNYIALSM